MPLVWSVQQTAAGRERKDWFRALEGKHLPGCYERLTPLAKCICGGPERGLLIEAFLERMALAQQEDSVG